ncbi:spore germination protein [Pseudobacteroides cellulosolvens]|uniref:GerA spore germination protein n=1 Tax=Pseudobacteroides cellulosolvens ATCC 35603 = DSM 2933 TaxID=398512 RepID=A0A0L6JK38_9FIRM|nr:spore germination protein [Pseudobacteroides cellulosolvens]KNY26083.1 GerA spore germination protein [Pseudobacteroides cellulosolvens ATCC 35603 = DSM 2933]
MFGFLKSLKKLITYEPKKSKTFELLEGSNEGVESDTNPPTPNIKSDNNNQSYKEKNTKRLPLCVDEWNKQKNAEHVAAENPKDGKVSTDLNTNIEAVKMEFCIPYNTGIITRQFKIARKVNSFIAYIDGMVDKVLISEFVIQKLMEEQNFNCYFEAGSSTSITDFISDNVVAAHDVSKLNDLNSIYFQILSGNTALFIDGEDTCLVISSRGYEKRAVEKPVTENVIMGSQEGFTENLSTNITLIRKIIKNKSLICEKLKIGKVNQSHICIMYINGIVNQEIVKEVKKRVSSIDTDFVLGDGMVGQFIEENPFMIFPQALTTERPDRVASFLAEGKVAIISEGTPFAEIVPNTFFQLLHTSEDAMLRWQYGTFLRIIRVLGMLIAMFLPAIYVALTLFHQEMIPTELLADIASSKEAVPFPTIVEIILLEVSFELIREGGIRIPGIIGQTLGIIGALILGQAAVAAGLVSPILIIIVAVTGLGSFAIPNYSLGLAVRMLRFFFIFLAGILGFYGISLGLFLVACISSNMKSFGVPFFSPVAPKLKSSPDLIIRQPVWRQKSRPDYVNSPNRKRQSDRVRDWKKRNKGDNNS